MDSTKEDIKKIMLLIFMFAIVWLIYNYTYKARYGDILQNMKIMDVPHAVKCYFGEENCDEGNIDAWSLLNMFVYFVIGYIVPGHYLLIIIVSIAFEIVKPMFGSNAKLIVDPLINLTGYAIGSMLSPKKTTSMNYKNKYELFVTDFYRKGLERDNMKNKVLQACMHDDDVPRAPEYQGTLSGLCYVDKLVDNYVDPREDTTYFSEDDFDLKALEYKLMHHDVLEEEML